MSAITQYWQTIAPIRKVGKLRGIIEIPTFTAPCGNKSCLFLDNGSTGAGTNWLPTTNFTIKFWVKFTTLPIDNILYPLFSLGADRHRIGTRNGKIEVQLITSDTYVLDTTINFQLDTWYHIAVTFADAIAKIYINGYLDAISPIFGTGVLITDESQFYIGSGSPFTETTSPAYISNFEAWVTTQDAQTILDNLYVLPYWLNNTSLKYLYNFREATGIHIHNLVDNAQYSLNGDPASSFAHYYPSSHLYNMCFIAGIFPVNTGGKSFSIKYPILNVSSLNFVLCVEGADGNRYKLWDNPSFFYAGTLAMYTGQKLLDGCKIEVWSLDGNETVDLTSVIDIETSIIHVVDSYATIAHTHDSDPVINKKLDVAFPFTFPMNFSVQPTYP